MRGRPGIFILGVVGAVVITGAVSIEAQRSQPLARGGACLHGDAETALERQRRDDALAVVRLTDRAVAMARNRAERFAGAVRPYPEWDAVVAAGMSLGRMDGGQLGRLARTIQWNSGEPLPGWERHYVAGATGYAFSLTDSRDACGFAYFVDDRGSVSRGLSVDGATGIVPVDSD